MSRIVLKVMALLLVALVPCVALAQQAPAKPEPVEKGKVILTWDQFVKITGYDPARKGGPQVLTVPWTEVEKLLGVKVEKVMPGAMVDLPWSEFKALLEWSVKQKDGPAGPPPTDYIVVSSRYVGTLSEEKGDFTLTLTLDVLRKEGWKRIPVLPAGVAVTKSTLPADVYLNTQGNHYELLTTKSGAMPVTIEFSVAATKAAGVQRLGFERVLRGSTVVDVTVDGTNVEVKLAGAQSQTTVKAANKTSVAAALPGSAPVAITWQRELPKVAPAPPKLYVDTRTLVAVAEGMLLCNEMLNYNILHSGVRELKLQVPTGAAVMTVSGRNVRDWRVAANGEMTVVLRGEALGPYMLNVNYEQPAKDSVQVPVVRATGVERERGFVGVVALANVEISGGAVDGATKIDVRQLPPEIAGMTNQPILLAYRYLGKTFNIPLNIKKHGEVDVMVTIVDSASFTAMQLNDGRRMTKVIYAVRNRRNQFLRMKMPEGAEIWSVSVGGNPASPAKDEEGNVLIPLVRSKRGATELASFPVEMVYVAKPRKKPEASGTLHVELPSLTVPAMQVMYTYYLPREGKYTIGWGRSGFSGPLRLVDDFAKLSTAQAGRGVVRVDVEKQAQALQQQVNARFQARVRATGATPIRVRLPINGIQFKLERILVLPGDKLWFEVQYSKWDVEE